MHPGEQGEQRGAPRVQVEGPPPPRRPPPGSPPSPSCCCGPTAPGSRHRSSGQELGAYMARPCPQRPPGPWPPGFGGGRRGPGASCHSPRMGALGPRQSPVGPALLPPSPAASPRLPWAPVGSSPPRAQGRSDGEPPAAGEDGRRREGRAVRGRGRACPLAGGGPWSPQYGRAGSAGAGGSRPGRAAGVHGAGCPWPGWPGWEGAGRGPSSNGPVPCPLSPQVLTELKSDNQRLKDENGALIRVISKLSK